MDTIDGHLHLFRAVSDEYPRQVYDPMAVADREERAEKLLDHMAAAGVDKAVVVPLSHHDDYLRDVLTEYPGRFAGVGVIDPDRPDQVGDLDRRIEEVGIQGLRVFGFAETGVEPEQLRLFPLFEAMRDRNIKVWFYAAPDQLELLDRVLDLLPGLPVVLNHLGFCPDIHAELRFDEHLRPRFDGFPLPPPTVELVERVARHPSVYVHLSGQYAFSQQDYPYEDVRPVVEAMYRIFGADRMLWASDYPWIAEVPGYTEQLALVDHFLPGLSTEERETIRGGTAASLFTF